MTCASCVGMIESYSKTVDGMLMLLLGLWAIILFSLLYPDILLLKSPVKTSDLSGDDHGEEEGGEGDVLLLIYSYY